MINLLKRNMLKFLSKVQFLIIPIICEIIYLLLIYSKNDLVLFIVLGSYSNISNSFEISFMLLINLFYIIFGYYLYYYDFKFSACLIFLRVKKMKWIVSQYISLLIIDIFITICFIIPALVSQIIIGKPMEIFSILIIVIINVILKLLLQLFVITFKKIGIFISSVLILFSAFFNNSISISLDNIVKNKWIIIILIALILETMIFNKKNFKNNVERI